MVREMVIAQVLVCGVIFGSPVSAADIQSWGAPYDTIVMHSSHVNEDFEINVLVLDDCATKKCPTIYDVDDDLFFGSMTGALYTLKSAGGPSAILVSIGYKGNGVSSDWGRKIQGFALPVGRGIFGAQGSFRRKAVH